jgi:mono/diheme cytochrome c family protein
MLLPTCAAAQGNLEKGSVSFVLNCAVCHGMDGRGKGPLADALKVAPVDLTLLAARHDGQFPAAKVSDVIRNGGAVLGHGSTEMPAWGEYFAIKGEPEVARSRIADLVRYLESIQAKMSPAPAP